MSKLESIRRKFSKDKSGVSPVIGVILMVAITVALVALVTVTVFDLGGDVSESPDATVQLEENSGEVEARILRNENVDELKLQSPDGSTSSIGSGVGDTATVASGDGQYSVIAVMSDGSEEILTKKDFTSINNPVTGTVSYNPPAEGVTVELVDGDGNTLDTDTTDADGSYSLTGEANTREVRVKSSTFSESKSNIDLVNDVGISQSNIPTELMSGTGKSSDPYEVETASDLQAIKYEVGAEYELVNDIDASHTSNWNNGDGFDPIGTSSSNPFTGLTNGKGHVVDGITIKQSGTNNVGVFAEISGGTVKNIHIVNADIEGSTATGVVTGTLVSGSKLYNTTVSGSVNGDSRTGGAVGTIFEGNVTEVYSATTVNGGTYTGGISGDVAGVGSVIASSYSTGDIDGSDVVGGIVGYGNSLVTVEDVFATGSISGNSDVGGVVGNIGIDPTVTDSYWNTETTGQSNGIGSGSGDVTGLGSSQMKDDVVKSNMDKLDFTDTWNTVTSDYPVLAGIDKQQQLDIR